MTRHDRSMATIDQAYTKEEFTHYENLIRDGSPRIPICFCIDVSVSMNFVTTSREHLILKTEKHAADGHTVQIIKGLRPSSKQQGVKLTTRITDLKKGISELLYGLLEDEAIADTALISIVTFSRHADTIVNFCELSSLDVDEVINSIKVDKDYTCVGEGIELGLQKIDNMSRILQDASSECYKPVFIFISDGVPTDADADRYADDLRSRDEGGEMTVIPIGFYMDERGENWLSWLSNDGAVYTMENDEEMEEIFDMIRNSIYSLAPVLSADEGLNSDKHYEDDDPEDIEDLGYGDTKTPDLLALYKAPDWL